MIVNTVIPLSLLALLIGVVLGTGLFMLRGYNGDRHARTLRNIARLDSRSARRGPHGRAGGATAGADATETQRGGAINAEAVRVARLHYRAEERASAIAETLRLLKGV